MSPAPEITPPTEPEPESAPPAPAWLTRWRRIASSLLLVIFCLELGILLLIFPWTSYWERNYFSSFLPHFEPIWTNVYLRGAVSGLGVLNIYISLAELLHLLGVNRP